MRKILLIFIAIYLTGCSAIDVSMYRDNEPRLELFEYFTGETKGWGIVQDRKGELLRQFTVDIKGVINEQGELVLYEDFFWSDGEESTRTWVLTSNDAHNYTGVAEDVEGTAQGITYGNVLNWKYKLNVDVGDSTWKLTFDDWMFRVSEKMLINRAEMLKFGFTVGEVTIVFEKL